jgi:hypothetical protein
MIDSAIPASNPMRARILGGPKGPKRFLFMDGLTPQGFAQRHVMSAQKQKHR